jgi:hypothetical protein
MTITDRPTPLTDALWIHCVRNPGPGSGLRIACHARSLERQRDAYAETLREIHDSGMCGNVVFIRHPELSEEKP